MDTTMCLPRKHWIDAARQLGEALPAKNRNARVVPALLGRAICLCLGHNYQYCTCQRCDKVRDEAHAWVILKGHTCKAKCGLCGLPKGFHDYVAGVCQKCGDLLEPLQTPIARDRRDPYDSDPTARLPATACCPPPPRSDYPHNPDDPFATSFTAHG